MRLIFASLFQVMFGVVSTSFARTAAAISSSAIALEHRLRLLDHLRRRDPISSRTRRPHAGMARDYRASRCGLSSASSASTSLRIFAEGATPQRSAFLSAFYLVGTHGAHVTVGPIWITVMFQAGRPAPSFPRTGAGLMCLSMFWHFLTSSGSAFTFVYLFGVIRYPIIRPRTLSNNNTGSAHNSRHFWIGSIRQDRPDGRTLLLVMTARRGMQTTAILIFASGSDPHRRARGLLPPSRHARRRLDLLLAFLFPPSSSCLRSAWIDLGHVITSTRT